MPKIPLVQHHVMLDLNRLFYGPEAEQPCGYRASQMEILDDEGMRSRMVTHAGKEVSGRSYGRDQGVTVD